MREFMAKSVCLLAGWFLCGCMPYHFVEEPGVLGKVVDTETYEPIEDVVVQLKYSPRGGKAPSTYAVKAKTSNDGSFHIQPKKKWGIYIVPMDFFPAPYTLAFAHEEYSTRSISFSHAIGDKPDTVDIGIVSLNKK